MCIYVRMLHRKREQRENAGIWQQTFKIKDVFNPSAEITTD